MSGGTKGGRWFV